MLSVDAQQNDEIGLDTPVVEGDARSPTQVYDFSDIMTPLGYVVFVDFAKTSAG